jgi:exonuclease VII large subunit
LIRSTNRQIKLNQAELKTNSKQFTRSVSYRLESAEGNQTNALQILNRNIKYFFVDQHSKILNSIQGFSNGIKEVLKGENQKLELYGKSVQILNPRVLLMKGYSITLNELRANIDPKKIKKGDRIITQIINAEIESEVIKITKTTIDEN